MPRNDWIRVSMGSTSGSFTVDIDLGAAVLRRTGTIASNGRYPVLPEDLEPLRSCALAAHARGNESRRDQFAQGEQRFELTFGGRTVTLSYETDGLYVPERLRLIWDHATGIRPQLSAARVRLDEERWSGALRVLLETWARSRSPELADVIEQLGRFLDRAVDPFEKGVVPSVVWASRMPSLHLADVTKMAGWLPEVPDADLVAHLPHFLELSPDPRVTAGLTAALKGVHGPAWPALLDLVAHTGDPRLRAPLERLVRRKRPAGFVKRAAAVLEALPTGRTEDVSLLTGRIEALQSQPAPAGVTEDRTGAVLARAARTDPRDAGAVEVWVDWLLQQNEPLGILARLQLDGERRALDPNDRARERELVEALSMELTGPLSSYLQGRVFRRGMLQATQVRRLPESLYTHPLWRSVEQITTSLAHLHAGGLPNVRRIGTRMVETSEGLRFHRAGSLPSLTWLRELAASPPDLPLFGFGAAAGGELIPVVEALSKRWEVRELHLKFYELDDEALEQVRDLPRVEVLTLEGRTELSTEVIAAAVGSGTRLHLPQKQ